MSPKILVVDDEPDILELAQTRLEMAGYETLTAESGEVALKCFFTERSDSVGERHPAVVWIGSEIAGLIWHCFEFSSYCGSGVRPDRST